MGDKESKRKIIIIKQINKINNNMQISCFPYSNQIIYQKYKRGEIQFDDENICIK